MAYKEVKRKTIEKYSTLDIFVQKIKNRERKKKIFASFTIKYKYTRSSTKMQSALKIMPTVIFHGNTTNANHTIKLKHFRYKSNVFS